MTLASVTSSIGAGKDRLIARIVKDLQSHRSVWNYIYMGLYVIIALYLTFYHADSCGNAVIMTTGGVVTAIFTNVVWSKTYERAKGVPDVPKPVTPTPEEDGASD